MTEPVNPSANDRLFDALRALIRGEFPQLTYTGIYGYVVQTCDGKTVDCDLEDPTVPLPTRLTKVPLKSSILGEVSTLSQGSRCLIAFVNSDPTRPVCVGCDPTPSAAKVEATGTLTLKAGGYPATEHVATVEGVVTMFVNFIVLLYNAGNPTTWNNVGKILDATDPTLTQLGLAMQTMLNGCNFPSLPLVTPPTAGGVLPPVVLAAVQSALAAKIPDLIPGVTPTGIGAPSVKSG